MVLLHAAESSLMKGRRPPWAIFYSILFFEGPLSLRGATPPCRRRQRRQVLHIGRRDHLCRTLQVGGRCQPEQHLQRLRFALTSPVFGHHVYILRRALQGQHGRQTLPGKLRTRHSAIHCTTHHHSFDHREPDREQSALGWGSPYRSGTAMAPGRGS